MKALVVLFEGKNCRKCIPCTAPEPFQHGVESSFHFLSSVIHIGKCLTNSIPFFDESIAISEEQVNSLIDLRSEYNPRIINRLGVI